MFMFDSLEYAQTDERLKLRQRTAEIKHPRCPTVPKFSHPKIQATTRFAISL
jgi:hypothetical protein